MMAEQSAGKGAKQASQDRDDRLKAALKANMARRKAQARGRVAAGTVAPLSQRFSRQNPVQSGQTRDSPVWHRMTPANFAAPRFALARPDI